MHENSPVLTATRRERVGSRYSQRIRQAGGLPAVVYGHGEAPVAIAVDAKEAITCLSRGDKVFQIQFKGESTAQVVLVKELQFDHLGTNVVHADFARVDLEERVSVRVAVHLVGEAVGLKTTGTVLMHPTNEIEIECKVANLPDYLEVNIAGLEAGGSLHARDIPLPLPTMKLLSDPGQIVAQIVSTQLQGGETTAEATQVAGVSQPEVITERKHEEG
ncbi:MAG: 50S ribosomal protein L25 [Phycisphaerales bacterium]|nr:50S ribosomal protein L25 [Phycisphaerales bacterium]